MMKGNPMQISISAPRTVADAQILLETIQFRPMDETDFMGFAGAEAGDLIGEFGDFGVCILGEFTVSFFDMDGEFINETVYRHADGEIYSEL
jgi:hypothetical protein